MCGISGYLAFSPGSEGHLLSKSQAMNGTQAHRGPDAQDAFTDRAHGLVLMHRRLSIIDLSDAGKQPMTSASGRYVIVFNGEIYNFLEIRKELESKAHKFRGHSDTEVMLAAFDEWGVEAALPRMNGMFAFCVYDQKDQRLIFARDRLGKKPLYLGWGADGFYFASELKAICAAMPQPPTLNREVARSYFFWRYVPEPLCIYDNFWKLRPGCLWSVTLDELRHPHDPLQSFKPFWSIAETAQQSFDTPATLDELEGTLQRACARRLIADVPLGAFLSGGVDSSLVVALMQSQSSEAVRSFTVSFSEDGYNEAEIAAAVAKHLGTDHTILPVSGSDALHAVESMPGIYDEPLADPSAIPTYLMCKAARKQITVAFSGDGGDESFGGYGWYDKAETLRRLPAPLGQTIGGVLGALDWQKPKLKKLAYLLRSPSARNLSAGFISEWIEADGLLQEGSCAPEAILDTLESALSAQSLRAQMMAFDSAHFMPGMVLPKVDRASMAVSMEIRSPLLDQKVVECAWRLPENLRKNKAALRAILSRYIPKELIERPKHPFLIPHGEWIKGPLKDWAEELLTPAALSGHGLLNAQKVQNIWSRHKAGKEDYATILWTILTFQAWHRRWGA